MKNRFLGIICFIYSFLIGYVWIFDKLKSFLAPNMQIYLKLSLVPMFLMGCVLCFSNKFSYKYKSSDLVLLLPVLMVFLAGNGNLSIKFAEARMTSISNKLEKREKVKDNGESKSIVTDDVKKIDDFYFDINDSTYSYLTDYITYMSGAKKFIGKTIRVRGFVVDYSDYLTSDYFALGKYAITCCAADAEFSGFMVKYDSTKVKTGKWYEVEGILNEGKDKEGYSIMVIEAVRVKPISSKGEEQYVYNCSTYGDGKCSDLLKYDLNY